MPLTMIRLEDVNGLWVGEVEIGSPISRRTVVRSATFEDAIRDVVAARTAFMDTFALRPAFAVVEPTLPAEVAENPDEERLIQDVVQLTERPTVVKKQVGRHRLDCDCERCEAKRRAA